MTEGYRLPLRVDTGHEQYRAVLVDADGQFLGSFASPAAARWVADAANARPAPLPPDARLAAAAPDLLEACKEALDLLGDEEFVTADPTFALVLSLTYAVCKAEGTLPSYAADANACADLINARPAPLPPDADAGMSDAAMADAVRHYRPRAKPCARCPADALPGSNTCRSCADHHC